MSGNLIRRNRLFQANIIVILILIFTPSSGRFSVDYLDKIVHFGLFMILSVNACFKFYKTEKQIDALIWSILFGLLTEVVQQFIPGRDMDIYDGIADALGVICGYYIYQKFRKKIDRLILKLGA